MKRVEGNSQGLEVADATAITAVEILECDDVTLPELAVELLEVVALLFEPFTSLRLFRFVRGDREDDVDDDDDNDVEEDGIATVVTAAAAAAGAVAYWICGVKGAAAGITETAAAHCRLGDNTCGAPAGVCGSVGLRLIAIDEMVMVFWYTKTSRLSKAAEERVLKATAGLLSSTYSIV
uniref:Uncharacterized protein n=1 Tax=Glossina austeni TaxID=7395 RepID=A0A1A9VEK1_GLOAU